MKKSLLLFILLPTLAYAGNTGNMVGSGAFVSGDCVQVGTAFPLFIDSGSPCGGGSSTISLGTSVTANNPQISGDATSGLYTPGASMVSIATGGKEVMRADNFQRIGIGTGAPTEPLHVYKNGSVNYIEVQNAAASNNAAGIELKGGNTNSDWLIVTNRIDVVASGDTLIFFKNAGSSGTKMVLQDNGFLGVGTIAPKNKVDVSGALGVGSYAGSTAAPTNGMIVSGSAGFGTNAPVNKVDISGALAVGSYAGTNTGPTNGLIVSGSSGFGTNSPLSPMDVSGGVAIGSYAGANAAPSNGLIVSGSAGFGTNSPATAVEVSNGDEQLSVPSTTSASSPTLKLKGWDSGGVAKTASIQNVFDVPNSQNKLLINGPAGTAFSSITLWNSGVIYITGTAELNTQVTRVQNSFLGFNLFVPISNSFQAVVARGAASQSADIFQVQNSGTTALFNVTASGSVGIGSSIPGSKLDINAGGNTDVNVWTTSGYNILSMNGGLTAASQTGIESGATGDDSLYVNAGNSGNIIFRTSGQVEKARIMTSTGFVGVGSNNPRAILDISQATGAIILPIGTTGQEPSAVEGMLRDNSTLKFLEGYINGIWAQLLSGSNGTPTCGTGCASITAGSTDARGSATSGTLATSVVINFSTTLPYTPFCAAGGSSTAAVVGCVPTTTALTCSLSTGLTGDVITWHCPQ